ncbi:hypoxia-inducible factor 3-alpha isoform X2 [Nilaparvata lugens]|uniref:hypoxia-inducible factor 3-alpha isoform X2 n=1 Tax=Nilaparvata lugens TaxID=108931 RepID=UPI00193E96EC|nr:hypoxia-inducible factor 3-alpha isoform X2 [Nilaparvata lugens]
MVDCCPQQTPMYHNGHTYTQQQAIALQQYYQQQQQQHYHNNYSPSSSSSSSSSHGYPSPPDQDYQRRLNAYCGFNNDPLNRNNGYVPPYNNYQLDNNRVYDQSRYQQQHMHHHMYRQHGHAYYHGHDTQLTSSSNPVRESRNRAEKNRRDKMLRSVHELGRIVPLVSLASAANKRTDRTGILRLTASFIRIETQLKPGLLKLLQPNIKSFDWEKFLLESLESVLLVVSGSGKIVFVSNTVKDLLGHDPLDMLGRQLTDYTQKNDCDELNKQLKINPDENTSGYTAAEVAASDDSSDSSSQCSGGGALMRPLAGAQAAGLEDEVCLPRSFLLRLSRGPKPPSKAAKNEKLDYQLVHVNGHLRLSTRPDPAARQLAKRNRTQQQYTENDVFLVALVRPVKERILTLGEFNVREEYITRHHIDGRIIYTDHRISMVAGYLPGEVTGMPGFKYMHKDDVMWTMIALQQMFCGGKRIGNSCYKMLTKNGKFIFMRTHGYIELADDGETIQSFVCINTVVSQQEFEKLNKEMKENFSPVMNQRRKEISNTERGRKEATPNVVEPNPLAPEVEDPVQLQKYIKNLLVEGIPSVPSTLDTPEDCKEIENFMNVVTKNIPPVSYLNQQMNLNPPVVKVVKSDDKQSSQGPPPPLPPPPPAEPINQSVTIKMQQQRPSVLRRIVSTREPTTSYEGCSVSKRMRTEVPVQETRATVLCQTPKPPPSPQLAPASTTAPPLPILPPLSPPMDYAGADSADLKLFLNAAASDYPCPFEEATSLGELVATEPPWLHTPTNQEYEALQLVEGLTKTQSHLELRLQRQTQSLTEITENLDMIQPSDLDDSDISTIARLRDLTETTTQQLSEQEVTLRDLQRDTQHIFLEGHNYPVRADAGDLQFLNNVDDKYL